MRDFAYFFISATGQLRGMLIDTTAGKDFDFRENQAGRDGIILI